MIDIMMGEMIDEKISIPIRIGNEFQKSKVGVRKNVARKGTFGRKK